LLKPTFKNNKNRRIKMELISSKELANNKEDVVIVDIRDSNQFQDWHINDSKNIDIYSDLMSGNLEAAKERLNELPKDRQIVTVCNIGVSSQQASLLLEELGYKTSVLEKGMMGWNSVHKTMDVVNENDLTIKQIARVGKGCLSYLIGSNSSKEAYIVDPSQYIDEYVGLVERLGFKIKGVIETHVHADHISGAKKLADITNSKYYVSSDDLKSEISFEDLKEINKLEIGNNEIGIMKTPGHTDGGICCVINNKFVLTGDSLFLDNIGRPDLGTNAEDSAKKLFNSLKSLKILDNENVVLPAHVSKFKKLVSKKFGELSESNEAWKIDSEEGFVKYILGDLPDTPPNYSFIKDINVKCVEISREETERLEFGPNRCASK
jgi:glyoxylase-like metal-dependent hydrolase (beta-lactamase superfamily II)/rhodanese-related sulfurtransferase